MKILTFPITAVFVFTISSSVPAYAQTIWNKNHVDACRGDALLEGKVHSSEVNAYIDKCMADQQYSMDAACKSKERDMSCYHRGFFWWLSPRKKTEQNG